ncbi:hypothetical protein Tco_1409389 [Tanacetum coccineum]
MFRATLKLPVETPKQPFIPPADFDYIQPFLKILGYQGPLERNNVIQRPRFTKLVITDLMEKYESIPKTLEEEYHSIKDDTPLDYVEKYGGVEVLMIQPLSVESTQRTHRIPKATRTPNPNVVQKKRKGKQAAEESSSPRPSLKIRIRQQKPTSTTSLSPIEKKILEEDVEKLVKGEDESDGNEFADTVLLSDEDFGNRLEPGSHKENPKKINDDDKTKDDKHDDAKDDDDDDHKDLALIRTQRMGSSEIRTEKMQTPIPLPLDPLGLTYLRIRLY